MASTSTRGYPRRRSTSAAVAAVSALHLCGWPTSCSSTSVRARTEVIQHVSLIGRVQSRSQHVHKQQIR